MRTTVNVFACGLVGLALVLCTAAAAEGPPAREPGWIPSFAINGAVAIQTMRGSVQSSCENGGPADVTNGLASCDFLAGAGPAALRPFENGSDTTVSPIVAFELQLMTPSLDVVPGRPRVFVASEARLTFPPTRKLALEGDPSGVTFDADNPALIPTVVLSGVGSQTASEVDTLGWGAGVGLAFPFQFMGRQLWLKPSARWTYYKVNVYGKVVAGLKDDPLVGPPWGSNIREVNLLADETHAYNGIGPGLDLELDAGRFGPVGVGVFIGGSVYRILGDRDVAFSTSQTLTGDNLPEDTYHASFTHNINPWMYRAQVGIRFNWLGH